MKPFLLVVLSSMIALQAFAADKAETRVSLFELHDERIPDGEQISIQDLEAFGFVRKQPDLEVRSLKRAFKWTEKIHSTTSSADGSVEKDEILEKPCVMVVLTDADARAFAALTERTKGKKLLIKLGADFRSAPRIMMAIESGMFWFDCEDAKEQDRILKALEPLTNPSGEQAGTGQPATRSQSKSEGSDKPQPESEGRSR
jgi:hypothetical protein